MIAPSRPARLLRGEETIRRDRYSQIAAELIALSAALTLLFLCWLQHP